MKRILFVTLLCAFVAAPAMADMGQLSWQTTPILGIDSSWPGDVLINNTRSLPWANIPHDAVIPYGGPGQPLSMTEFYVGESVHSGSGVWMGDGANNWTSVFTGPSRTLSYSGSYTPGDNFFMIWNTPAGGGDGQGVANLTSADVGNWTYTESWTNGGVSISQGIDFTVVPVPGAVLLGFLGLGAAGLKLRKHV